MTSMLEEKVIDGVRRPRDGAVSGSFVDLLTQVHHLLSQHPMGVNIRLLHISPDQLALGPNDVLVESMDADQGVMIITPRPLDQLSNDDFLHDASVINPHDTAFFNYVARPRADTCYTSKKEDNDTHTYLGGG